MHFIYKITDTINNKVYIGQTIHVERRWQAHRSYAKNPERTGQYIHRAMATYGIDNFNYEVIACAKIQLDADEAEAQIINQFNSQSKEFGYNIKPGGGTKGHSEETRQKLREATLKQIATKGPPGLGSKRTDEQKAKLSASLKALDKEKIYTPEVRKRMSDAHIGKSQPKELVEKRAATIRTNKGEMICGVTGCGEIKRRSSTTIDGIRYCDKHALRLKTTGTLELRPRKAHNKKQFTPEEINEILSDKRAAAVIGKDFGVSEPVILRIRKEAKRAI